jgi:hypothetical protein
VKTSPLKRKNSTTAKLSIQGRNFVPLIKFNNAPILKTDIFPLSHCGYVTLTALGVL